MWAEDQALRAIALLADQKPVLDELTQGVPEAMERFQDDDELARLSEFLSTVAEIERLTGLDFGDLRDADVRSGQESMRVTDAGPDPLKPRATPGRKRPKAKGR